MKKQIKMTVWRLLLAFLCVLIMGIILGQLISIPKAEASGYSTMTFYPGNTQKDVYWLNTDYQAWSTVCHLDSSTALNVDGNYLGWMTASTAWKIYASGFGWDISALPADIEVISIKVRLFCSQKQNISSVWTDFYWSLYKAKPENGTLWQNIDFDSAIDDWKPEKDRISAVQKRSWVTVNSTYEIEIPEEEFVYMTTPDAGGYVWAYASTENHMLTWQPQPFEANKYINIIFEGYTGHKPELVITYIADIPEPTFTYHDNAAIDDTILGNEVADNITLSTLSCMYAHEDLEFKVAGDSGASLALTLLDNTGKILDSLTESIRVDNLYAWRIDSLATNYQGFVRVKENNFNLTSPWVRVEPKYSSSQASLKIYARSTEYPQYTEPFSSYVVNRGSLMIVHWKTNINGSTELNDHWLKLYLNGDNITPIYSKSFVTLAANYFKGTVTNQQAGIHWRFACFTPLAIEGTNLYGDLIQNLNLDFTASNKGFLQSVIYKDSISGELTQTHSAHWYLTDASQGIALKMGSPAFKTDSPVTIVADIGRECNVEFNLGAILINSISGGTVVSGDLFTASEGRNEFTIDGRSVIGTYTARVKFFEDNQTYAYIYDIPFEVTETGLTDLTGLGWAERGDAMLKGWNLDNPIGHWLLIMAAMVILFIVCFRSEVLRVVLPLMVLGGGIIIGWVDIWLVVLLALGAGLILFGILRKRVHGGGGE